MFFASSDTHVDFRSGGIVEISRFSYFSLIFFDCGATLQFFSLFSKCSPMSLLSLLVLLEDYFCNLWLKIAKKAMGYIPKLHKFGRNFGQISQVCICIGNILNQRAVGNFLPWWQLKIVTLCICWQNNLLLWGCNLYGRIWKAIFAKSWKITCLS